MRGYDSWVTREPPWFDYEPPVYKCARCGKFLRHTPDYEREFVAVRVCDGKPRVYTDEYDERTVAILGDEYRGKTYQVAFAASCGHKTGDPHGGYEGEIGVKDVPDWTHEPHVYADPHGWTRLAVRTCGCGHENEEVL